MYENLIVSPDKWARPYRGRLLHALTGERTPDGATTVCGKHYQYFDFYNDKYPRCKKCLKKIEEVGDDRGNR